MADLLNLDPSAVSQDAIGTPLAWPEPVLQAMEAYGIPREMARRQAYQPRPRSVVRKASVSLVQQLEDAANGTNKPSRTLLVGEPGCGKSTYLVQSLAHAVTSGWAVVYVPRTIDLINSSSAYVYNSALQTYLQPDATTALLKAMLQVNAAVFKRITTADELRSEQQVLFPASTPLDQLVKKTLADHPSPVVRQQALDLVWATLAKQTAVPVLVAIDDVQALFGVTRYRDADFACLQAYELAVPRSLLSLFVAPAQGEGIQRGMLLASMSLTHAEYPPSPELLVTLRDAAQKQAVGWARVRDTLTSPTSATRVQEPNAFTRLEEQHVANARRAQWALVDVGERLSRPEAASILDLMQREQMLWATPNDEHFVGKLVESNGNVRAFERSWRSSLV